MGLFSEVLDKQKSTRIKHPKVVYSGCLNCPSNKTQEDKIPDYAIFEPIQDKPILVIAMRPAKTETEQGKNLVGKSGQLLWRRAEKLKAFTREQCNTDNVVRCRGSALNENGYEVERAPSKVELKCCDLHTQNRKTKYKPKVVLILGTEAQKQFLGKRYNKKQKTYWDPELKCKVICTFHPSFFLRGYGGQEQAWKEFDKALLEVKQTLKYPGRYGFIKSLDIKRLENPVEVEQMFTEFRKQKRFVVFDMEWGTIAQGDGKKKLVILCIAFCNDVGKVRVVFYHHPETTSARVSDLITRRLVRSTCQFLADGSVKKAAWHGISDVRTVKKVWGVDVRGYDIDGEYSEFFVYPNRKDYRLETTTDVRFKQFAGYKDIVNPYVKEEMNFALVPVSVLLLRCGVDALVTRKAILTTLPKTSKALVKMYVQSSFVLEESGSRGMLFDFEHAIRLEKIYGPLLEQLDREISMTAGVPDFDITDTNLRWLLIKKLKLPLTKLTKGASKLVNKKLASESEDGHGRRYEKLDPEDVRRILVELYGEKWWKAYATDKEVMEEMVGEHPIVLKIMQRKFLFKDNSTYIEGFRESARANGGYVKTRFKMTGASSGRISSGGDRANNPSEEKKVNLQNISGDLNTKNMLVSTINWSKIFNSWKLRNQESEE